MIESEFEFGVKSLQSGEAAKGSKLFSQGIGRNGKSLEGNKFLKPKF